MNRSELVQEKIRTKLQLGICLVPLLDGRRHERRGMLCPASPVMESEDTEKEKIVFQFVFLIGNKCGQRDKDWKQ